MTGWFSKISLRWKLASVTVLATTVALLMTGVIMATYDVRTYEAQKVGAITSEAEILAASVAAALIFNDSEAALEYLKAFDANPEIVAAAAYDVENNLITSYVRPGVSDGAVPATAGAVGSHFEGGELGVFVQVKQDNNPVGTVYLKASVEPVGTRLARYTFILLIIGAGALAVILPISLWLHRLISNPIEELAARNAIIQATLDSVDHGVVVVGGDMKVAFLNERVAALFKVSLPEIVDGMDFNAVMREAQDSFGLSADRREADLARLQSSDHARDQYVLPDGRTIEYRQAPLPQGGFVRTYTDISEEKLLQERLQQAKIKAEDAAKAKSQFLAAMSHEIRTPMSGVIGIVELLRSTELTAEQKQMVELIQRSGIGLLDVINDILDYSKIEAGRMTVEKTDFALAEIVETTAAVIGGHTQSKTLNVVCSIDPAIDQVVKGDPVRIRQIVLNLMGNAVKFTEKGTVAIEARADSLSDDQITVLFEITDTGMGIAAEKQKQLFQPFSQADYSTTRKFGGTGLGLSISKNLIELMDGEIGLRSEVGKGSTFWFKVPFARLPPDQRGDSFAAYKAVLKGLRVLVCDPLFPRSASGIYLRAAGVEVIEVGSYTESIERLDMEKAAGRTIDAAVICLRIGDENAARFTHEVSASGTLRNVKTIIVAPHLSGSAAKMATSHRPAAVLSAPLRRLKVYDTVAAVTGRAVDRREISEASGLNFTAPSVDEALAQGCLVLVAEDNQTNQFVIKNQMRRLGFAAEFVNDGREAWETLTHDEKRYSLLITDCHMPFIDGYQLTGLIRDRELMSGRRLPVVALTANALEGEAEICRAAGMDAYLSKPTDLATLDAMVLKWLPRAADLRKPASGTDTANPLNGTKASAGRASEHTHGPDIVIDTSVLVELLGSSDPAALREMLGLYLSTEAETPGLLKAFAEARDGVGLAKAAHAAKGAASSAGARRMQRLCKEIEDSAARRDWATVIGLSSQIDAAFEDVRKFIETY